MINLLDYLKILPDTFPSSVSKALLELPKSSSPSVVSDSIKGFNKINDDYRITNNIHLEDIICKNITYNMQEFWNSYLHQYYQTDIKNIEQPQLLHYNIGGKYDVHNDCEDFIDGKLTRIVPRDVTILAYLNDDYEGGEIEFPDYGITIKPTVNMVITFPSYYEFQHRVKPVTKGERFTLVTWIETTERIYDRPYEMGRCKR